MAWGIFSTLFYLLGLPLLLRLVCFGQEKLIIAKAQERASKRRRSDPVPKIPSRWWDAWMEKITFTIKDKRPLSFPKKSKDAPAKGPRRNIILFILYGIGLIVSAIPFITQGFHNTIFISWFIFLVAIIFAFFSAQKLVNERKRIAEKMFQIVQTSLKPIEGATVGNSVQVTDWVEYIKPNKVTLMFDISFSDSGVEPFLKQFNQVFGKETAWVTDDSDEGPGWDFEEGVAKLRAVPPLPTMAPWKEHYVLDPAIAWSFFPIALGVENGVELKNPETGEIENVLGFDLSGEQQKFGKKAGVRVSQNIVTSPMVLVGGGTGGGKSVSADTPIKVLKK